MATEVTTACDASADDLESRSTPATAVAAGAPLGSHLGLLQVADPVAAAAGRTLLLAVVTAFGLTFVGLGLLYLRKGRQIRRRARPETDEVTAVADLSAGPAVVAGTARPVDDRRVEAPITGRPALAAEAEARGPRHYQGPGGSVYRILAREHAAVPFVVEDDTGWVRVEPPESGTVDVELATVASALFGEFRGAHAVFWAPDGVPHAEGIRAFHERSGDLADDPFDRYGPFVVGSAARYSEGILRPDGEVWVHGTAVERDADWGEPGFAVTGDADARFVLSDRSPPERAAPILRRGRRRYYSGTLSLLVGLAIVVGAWILL